MKTTSLKHLLLLTTLMLCLAAGSASAQKIPAWADSLSGKAALTSGEHPLQFYFDSLGFDINVAEDELGTEIFCGIPGVNSATMVIEVAGSAVYATSGYYKAGDTSVFYQLFGPSNHPGDSVTFNFNATNQFGFYMKPNLPGDNHRWLTEIDLNSDDFDHAWVFPTGVPHEYLIAWEDLPNGGDADYNDLVIRVRFANKPPVITLPNDTSIVACDLGQICFPVLAVDPNCQGDSIWVTMLEGEGSFTPQEGVASISTQHCFTPTVNGTYRFIFKVEDILGAVDVDTVVYDIEIGHPPTVYLPDSSVFLCSPQEICLPVEVLDPDCDVVSVTTNLGSYSGTMSGFDQVARLDQLGGTITQIGGGMPGKTLYQASDFVAPVNSQSGVAVSLPNFSFATGVVDYGSFSSSATAANGAPNMLDAPTDLTFTLPGAGGPDGGSGDGSVTFSYGNKVVLGFPQTVTTCNGANVDFIIFTSTCGSGTAELRFRKNGATVYTINQVIPSGAAQSGLGGVTVDLPDGITFNEVRIKNIAGSFDVDAVAVRTAASSSTEDICFMADTAGVYDITVTAIDGCGHEVSHTAYVTVAMNHAPVVDAGTNQNMFLCQFGQICLPISFSDPDNNLTVAEKTLGPGTLNDGTLCFTPTMAGAYTFVFHAADACGLHDYDTVVVTIDNNDPPVADDVSPVTVFQCAAAELCHTFTATDPNGGPLTWTHLGGVGAITPAGQFCFTPPNSGNFGVAVIVTDSCGAADTVSMQYNVTLNTAPVAVDPPAATRFLCSSQQLCFQFQANDAQGGALAWTMLSGEGTLSPSGQWCFTPTVSGTYTAQVVVADSCGMADTTGKTYTVTVNEPPQIAFGADTALMLCAPQQICLNYTVSDPQGLNKLVESMVAGFGTIDTAANRVCFTPTTAGSYQFIVKVQDSCGAIDKDTIQVNVTFGEFADITCPANPINVSLCAPDSICQSLAITPAGAAVTVSQGEYADGKLCLYADHSGTYNVTVIAAASCGSDTCHVTFNVEIGEAAQIDCPAPQNVFICQPGQVCIPVGVMGTGAAVTVSPIGSYASGQVCFPADTAGHYEITVIASTTCGTDTCVVTADVAINASPVAVDPTTPVDTFLCATGQICYQFSANDVNGGALTWSRLSGDGTVSAAGLWCFNAITSDSYGVTAVVTDACGAKDTVSMTYNVGVNHAPEFAFGDDTTIFVCHSQQVCVPFEWADADNNITETILLQGTGVMFTSTGTLCFTPATEGLFTFIGRVTDACGVQVIDTLVVTVDFNASPVVNAGNDLTRFQCAPAPICWPVTASDPDGNLSSVTLVSGPGTYDGTNICFTPTGTLDYEFVMKATDACGATDYDTVVVHYTLNTPPVADAGADNSYFLCQPQEICWTAGCSDVDGNLSGCALVSGPGSYNGSQICFTPTASGSYTFVIEASDACGATDRDTVVIGVTLNTAPVCHVPNDTAIFQCTPTQVCLPVSGSDVDGNLDHCQIISGQGTLSGGYWCYTPTASQSVSVTIRCVDECGAICESDFTVEFEINHAPTIAFGADYNTFLCDAEEICLPYTVADQNDPRSRTISLVSGSGNLDTENDQVCFTADASGQYTFVIRVEDECGAADQDTITVGVTLNAPPAANAGADQSLFLCDADTVICWPVSCSDPNGNLTDCLFNGPGTYDGSSICFSPATSGSYQFTLRAIDECGEVSVDTVTIDVTLNSTPTVAFGPDSSLQLCQPQEICVEYTVDDPDGVSGLVETMVSGYGLHDAGTNSVCFTPTSAGSYEIVVRVTDPCGAYDEDTVVVHVTFGDVAAISCPTGPLGVSLCAVETVCQGITVTPSDAAVSVSYGTYSDGELCFLADTTGVYIITVIAEAECGADTCEFEFDVEIGQAAQIDCPEPFEQFLCAPGDVCFPIGVAGTGVSVTVSPIGSYTRGNVCFPADTSGHYEITVIANTPCGSDTCVAEIDVTINSAPVALDLNPIDSFICAPQQFCFQMIAEDVDGQTLTWSRLSGAGSITSGGLWCFTANTSGQYSVHAAVTDPCGAADSVWGVFFITLNTPPVVTFVIDTATIPSCDENVCVPIIATAVDAENNIVLDSVWTDLPYTYDTAFSTVCFTATPGNPGPYFIYRRATDACGVTDEDTMRVMFEFNQPPVVNLGPDQDLFLCTQQPITIPFTVQDDNDATSNLNLVGDGDLVGSTIRFTPSASGVFTFILTATDHCGATGVDTVNVTVTLNAPPVCQIPADANFFQCAPEQVSLPVSGTDPDDNFDHCELVSGPGSLVGGNWVYTPSTDESVTVVVMCLDECGASCIDTFHVAFDINAKPVADAGADQSFFLCGNQTVCWEGGCSDVDGNLASCEVIAPAGATINSVDGTICLPVQRDGADKIYSVIIKATDSCGATDLDTARISIDFNSPPEINLPPTFVAYLEAVGELCFNAGVSDEDDNLSTVTVSPVGIYSPSTGEICFDADTTGTYCLQITATDSCGAQTIDTICVDVEVDQCIHVQIEKTHNVIQGQHNLVDIFLNGTGHEVGGFDFLIYYDPSALSPVTVTAGDLLENCGWEYFTYRYGPNGNCGGCPNSLLRILAIAETNNGAYHPGCFLDGAVGVLATIDFQVSNDRNLECQYAPVEFFWHDCGDNTFSSRDGDTLWVSRTVYDFEFNNITNNTYGFPGRFGAPDQCLIPDFPDKPFAIRCVDFTNGGVDIICADSIDARGDINLNGIAYEVADAVMFTNYFITGFSAFAHVQGSVAASDVNADGLPLTVADLVYLIRVVIGDTPATPKYNPLQVPEAVFLTANGRLTLSESPVPIGALLVVLEGNAHPALADNARGMELRTSYDGTETRALVYNMNGDAYLESGQVLTFDSKSRIKSIEVGGYDGQVLAAKYGNLPDRFELSQNYPNPFNPLTVIEFALPQTSKWHLTVFNVLGQTVEEWSGEYEAGFYKIEWDAGRYASGVYLYRFSAGAFSTTKKMVLLK